MARAPGVLTVAETLRPMLVAIRKQLGITASPTVALKDLVAVETYLGGAIPNDLLAYWLAVGERIGALSEHTRFIDSYYRSVEEPGWKKKLAFAHVAFDDTHSEEGMLCARLAEEPAKIEAWMLRKGEGWKPAFLSEGSDAEPHLVSYCRWKHGACAKRPVDFAAPISADELDAFVPQIMGDDMPAIRRVRHAKFGEGVVVGVIPPDKLEIDFGSLGVKKLLAAMVEDV